MQETQIQSLGQEDPLEKEMATRFSILAWKIPWAEEAQFSSVAQSCLTPCDPVDCSKPGLPVHHQLLEFTQTHAHRVGDAIQTSHPLSSPSPPAFNLSQLRVFSNESVLRIRWPKYWSFSFINLVLQYSFSIETD